MEDRGTPSLTRELVERLALAGLAGDAASGAADKLTR